MKELCIFEKVEKNGWTVDIFPRNNHSQHKNQLRGSVAPRMAQPTSTGEAFWRAFIEQ